MHGSEAIENAKDEPMIIGAFICDLLVLCFFLLFLPSAILALS
jgi:hypothetical protein